MSFQISISTVLALVLIPLGLSSQTLTSSPSLVPIKGQERRNRDPENKDQLAYPQAIRRAIEGLRQAVNRHSAITTQCRVQGQDVDVNESFEIIETKGCAVVVTTVKKNSSQAGYTRFTLRANLKDLTTPTSVEPLKLSGCEPKTGALFQIVSRTQLGKTLRTTRISQTADTPANDPLAEKEVPPRKGLSFFFASPELAKKAARALDRAVAACGGEEWPDEDDLP
jgi:hypothetical protein